MIRTIVALSLVAWLAACSHRSAPTPAPTPATSEVEESAEHVNPNPGGAMSRVAQRLNSNGTLPADPIGRMLEQRSRMATPLAGAGLTNWRSMGPTNIGGRIRAIVYHPTSPTTLWAGAAFGGIWKTTDAGANWTSQDGFPTVLPIGCLAVDPANPNRVLVGTGEGVFDSIAGTSILAAPRGSGIWETTDGGTSWRQLPGTTGANWHFVNRLVFHPTSPNIALVATRSGIWRSTDGGATWTRRLAGVDAFDVEFDPNNGSNAVAGGRDSQAWYSNDGGTTWNTSTGAANPVRIELHYAKSSANTVYAAVSAGGRIKAYRSNDGGRTYALVQQGSGIQTWSRYNNTLWVDPTNANNLLIGAVRLYRSTDGGRVFTRNDSNVHADQHIIVEHPNFDGVSVRQVFVGHDGGINRTNNVSRGGIVWTKLNGLGVTQFYGAAINPTTGTIVGGAQDNGTMRYNGTPGSWTATFGGDGGYCAADPTNPNYFYGEVQNLRIFRSTNGGNSASYIYQGISESRPNFIPPFILDPNDANRMLAAGARLWRTNAVKAGTVQWSPIKPAISSAMPPPPTPHQAHFAVDPPFNISAIAVAPGNSSVIWVGHNNGSLFKTTNGTAANPTWTKVDTNTPALPNRWISRIAVDPRNNNRVYVTIMGYTADNVWRTTDGGTTWTQITGSGSTAIPSAPATSVAVHRALPGSLYVGTDLGLFVSTDDGASWTPATAIGGRTPVEELVWKNARELMVVTHGRGIYLVDTGPAASTKTIGQGCGIGRTPRLTAPAPVPGTAWNLQLTNTAPNAPVIFALAAGPAVPFGIGNGCSLYINLATTALFPAGQTNGSGAWTYQLGVPALPTVLGATFTAQTYISVAGGPAFGTGELSNGVEVVIGL